jgi:hypothetical protein
MPTGGNAAAGVSMTTENQRQPFSRRILEVGFVFGLVLSGLCLILSGVYLFRYLDLTSNAIDISIGKAQTDPAVTQIAISARLAIAKYSLCSCGIVSGLAFGFLGFALFLIGIRTDMDVESSHNGSMIHLARIAPGTFVILCASLLIGVSVTHQIDVSSIAQYSPLSRQANQKVETLPLTGVGNDRKP